MAETEIQTSLFEFTGNHLCLDFTNTVQDRSTSPRELLNSYNDLYYGARRLRFSLKARQGNSARKLSAAGKRRQLCSSELLTYGKHSTAYSWQ